MEGKGKKKEKEKGNFDSHISSSGEHRRIHRQVLHTPETT